MKVLITGADGFIGSHLTEMLLEKNYQVRALSYYNSFNFWGWIEDIRHPNLEVVCGDIRDPFFCRNLLEGIDIVFHLAALIAIPYSYVAPQSYVETNITGTINICEAAKFHNTGKVIVTSTSEVYGTAQYVPIDENHPKQPQSPYSASKISADMMALSYFNSFDLPVVVARPFNTYGPRQSARAVIPSVISQIASGVSDIQLGSVSPTRDFCYVKDTCQGFVCLAESEGVAGQEFNISTNSEISIRDLVMLIAKIMNKNIVIQEDNQRIRPENSEVQRLCGDYSKITRMFGFKPEYSLEKGLEKTIQWFSDEKNLTKYKPGIYNI